MSSDSFGSLEKLARIASAKTTKEALALASAIQQDASRDLIQCVEKLQSSVDELRESSDKTNKSTNKLVLLTLVLTACTAVLVYLTWILANTPQTPASMAVDILG